jgi:hypothetical protein
MNNNNNLSNQTFFDDFDDNSVRPPDESVAMTLIDYDNGFTGINAVAPPLPLYEEDPELALVLAESLRLHEESMSNQVEELSILAEIERIEREEKERKKEQQEKDKNICLKYKTDKIVPHIESVKKNCLLWNRISETKIKSERVQSIIERYLSTENSLCIYIYLNEDEYIDFFNILTEMKNKSKVKFPIDENCFEVFQQHFLLKETSDSDSNNI